MAITYWVLFAESRAEEHQERQHCAHQGKAAVVVDPRQHFPCALALSLLFWGAQDEMESNDSTYSPV